jgi:hypothetical protein
MIDITPDIDVPKATSQRWGREIRVGNSAILKLTNWRPAHREAALNCLRLIRFPRCWAGFGNFVRNLIELFFCLTERDAVDQPNAGVPKV